MSDELSRIKDNPKKFWLGPVVKIHEIGEYAFVEYQEIDFTSPNIDDRKKPLTGKNGFSIFINGHSISRSASNLDLAMIAAVAHKYDGLNSQAALYFAKMVGINVSE